MGGRTVADVQYGDLLTPINSSPLVKGIMKNLSAYRADVSPLRRGLEGNYSAFGIGNMGTSMNI